MVEPTPTPTPAPTPAPIRVGLEVSCTAKAKPSGIARYALELIGGLDRIGGADRYTLFYRFSRLKRRRHFLDPPSPRFDRRLLTETFGGFNLRRCDVLHGTDVRVPRRGQTPTVSTIHDVFSAQRQDLAHAHFRDKKLAQYRFVAERATRILISTETVREEFLGYFPAAAGRIRVVPFGISPDFGAVTEATIAETRSRLGLERPYLLFAGLLSTRKNCVRMIQAFDRIADKFPDIALVLAGQRSHGYEPIAEALAASSHRDRIAEPGYLSWSDLTAVYGGAEALVFTTLREGFGFPILEAMAAGTRVLASDQAVPHEVGGEHPVFADPESVEAIAEGMEALLAEAATERSAREAAGRAWAARFTWESCARGTLAVYREAAATR